MSININDNNIHKPNEDKATGCPRLIVVTINPQLAVPNILPNLPLNPCSPKYSPINSSDIRRCIYGLSQLHTPEIRIPVNPLINHHILSEIIKIPADIENIRFSMNETKRSLFNFFIFDKREYVFLVYISCLFYTSNINSFISFNFFYKIKKI